MRFPVFQSPAPAIAVVAASVTALAALAAAGRPGGRLTLTSGVPVLVSDVSAAGTVYYTPHISDTIMLYDGSVFGAVAFTELSNVLANSAVGSAGPAAVATNSNYDLFVWSNAGTLTLTRGPLWTSDTGRGTGAGTTELTRIKGIFVNAVAITNGPAANRGTYVGTIRTDGSSKANFTFGGQAAGGTAALLTVWNAYNRVLVSGKVNSSTASWTYGTNTWRSAGTFTGLRVSWVAGLQADAMEVHYDSLAVTSTGKGQVGIGLDSTSAPSGIYSTSGTANAWAVFGAHNDRSLGFHFGQALERSVDTVNVDYYTDGVGLTYEGWF